MDWQEICIYTTTAGIEVVAGQLLNFGVNGWVVEDKADFEDFLNRESKNWDYIASDLMSIKTGETKIIFYLVANGQGNESLVAIKQSLVNLKKQDEAGTWGSLKMEVKGRKQAEWEDIWKQYYKPFRVGEKLVVKPSWEVYENPPGEARQILEIDPNASFGTGQHYTTRLCLESLEKAVMPSARVLDVGCGTGILGIGAMLLGATTGVGVDIEEHSMTTAKFNAIQNGIPEDAYTAYCGNILTDEALVAQIGGGYDVVVANIIADVIIAMADLFKQFLNTGGILICSGIIDVRADEVKNALADLGFAILEVKTEGGWVAIIAQAK